MESTPSSEVVSVYENMKAKFYAILQEQRKKICKNSMHLSTEKYNSIVGEVLRLKSFPIKKTPRDYWVLNHYDVLVVQCKKQLIVPIRESNLHAIFYVKDEELFDIFYEAHVSIGHGGRDRMIKALQQKYKNVTRGDVKLFLELCESCKQKRKNDKTVCMVVEPMVFSEFNSSCQVDFIDYQSRSDGDFKFIMAYQDNMTKFVILKALKFVSVEEVADKLLDIFTLIGPPSILQSSNGREFVEKTIDHVCSTWPELTAVHGKPVYSQMHGSVERAGQDIENLVNTWMQDNKSRKWTDSLRYVQFTKNRIYHIGIKTSPYEALFGSNPKVGLQNNLYSESEINSEDGHQGSTAPYAEDSEDSTRDGEDSDDSGTRDDAINAENSPFDASSTHPPVEEVSSCSFSCVVCTKECGSGHICSKCNRPVHAECGKLSEEEEGTGSNKLLCLLCSAICDISKYRQDSSQHEALSLQSKRMKYNFR